MQCENFQSRFLEEVEIPGGSVAVEVVVAGAEGFATPNEHLGAGPDGGVQMSGRWAACGDNGSPSIGGGVIDAATLQGTGVIAAPDDHFGAGPDGCMVVARL